jgi:hypothetical protein
VIFNGSRKIDGTVAGLADGCLQTFLFRLGEIALSE